jgi:hypothetical protein
MIEVKADSLEASFEGVEMPAVVTRPVLSGGAAVASGFGGYLRSGSTVEMKSFNATSSDAGGYALLTPDAVATIELPIAAIGSSVRVLASGVGDTGGPVEAYCTVDGASVRPLSPVHLRLDDLSGTPTLTWARRSRAGFRWIDGGDVPLAEEGEAYRLSITPMTGLPRSVTLAYRACPLAPGEAVTGTIVEIRQIGTFGESPPALLILP